MIDMGNNTEIPNSIWVCQSGLSLEGSITLEEILRALPLDIKARRVYVGFLLQQRELTRKKMLMLLQD